jgi:hypothetical protein
MVQALLNWTTSGRPVNRHHFTREVDSVFTTTAHTYRDAGTADTLVAARSLLLLNHPEEALAKVESVLIERARSYESKFNLAHTDGSHAIQTPRFQH